MNSRTMQALTALGLTEATVAARGGDEAAFSAAQHARGLRGDASLYYSPKQRKWAYGIKSKSTGGANLRGFNKSREGDYQKVADIRPGGSVRTTPHKGRMQKHIDKIVKSKHLSPEEREAYMIAALKKKGRVALPRSVKDAIKGTVRQDTWANIKRPRKKTTRTQRAIGAVSKLLGSLKSRLTS